MKTKPSRSPATKPDPPKRFDCGCGKSYQSYPTLCAHIKQKHQGNAPTGSSSRHHSPVNSRKTVISEVEDIELIRSLGYARNTDWTRTGPQPEFSPSFVKILKSTHTCHDAFVLYCESLVRVVSSEGFTEFTSHLELLREYLNENGWSLTYEEPQGEYCATQNAQLVPIVANNFIQEYSQHRPGFSREIAVVFMMHLCNWLLSNSYTTYKVNLIQY